MEILRAIENADALCPNQFTLEEKLGWCDEVTAELRRNIIKNYNIIETTVNGFGELVLPDEIPFERVEVAYIGNKRLEKQDFRSFGQGSSELAPGKRLRVVYLDLPEPIRHPDIRGLFNTGDNTIEVEDSPFAEGDKLEIVSLESIDDEPDWSTASHAFVMEVQSDMIILDRDAVPAATQTPLAIRRVIEDVTAVDEAPYDRMYTEYILAKMALYQHDYTAYNAHTLQYNSLIEDMKKEYKTRSPLTTQSAFKNYSRV